MALDDLIENTDGGYTPEAYKEWITPHGIMHQKYPAIYSEMKKSIRGMEHEQEYFQHWENNFYTIMRMDFPDTAKRMYQNIYEQVKRLYKQWDKQK